MKRMELALSSGCPHTDTACNNHPHDHHQFITSLKICRKSHHVPQQTSQLSCFSGSSEKSPTWLYYQRCLKRGSYRLIISTAAAGLLRQSTNYIHQTPAGFSNYEHLACHLSDAYREACLFFAAWFVYCVPWNNRHRGQDEVCAEKRFPSWPGGRWELLPPSSGEVCLRSCP